MITDAVHVSHLAAVEICLVPELKSCHLTKVGAGREINFLNGLIFLNKSFKNKIFIDNNNPYFATDSFNLNDAI